MLRDAMDLLDGFDMEDFLSTPNPYAEAHP